MATREKSAEKPAKRKLREVEAELFAWGSDDVPTEIAGEFLGFKDGKYGAETLMRFRRKGRVETWTVPGILHSKLEVVPVGSYVEIFHLGSIDTKNGQKAHNFRVMVEDPQEELPI